MAQKEIEYLKAKEIKNIIVFQSKTKRIWLSDLLEQYSGNRLTEYVDSRKGN